MQKSKTASNFVLWLLCIALLLPLSLPAQDDIPSPEKYLGFRPGEDYKLANYETIIAYFQILAQKSPKLKLREIGKTTEGRPLYLAIISSPENLQNSADIIRTQARLADPRDLRTAEAKKLVQKAKVIVSINCSIHPNEIGPSQMSMELAYQLLTARSDEVSRILQDVVLLLLPSHNPDGLNMVVDWYNEYRGTDYEASRLPFLYQKYCGHDLNRDWFTLTQNETRLTVEEIYNVWRPHIVFDLHQMGSYGARMFLPPYVDPYDDMIDPIIQSGLAMMGTAMVTDLISHGNQGTVFHAYFDSFSPARTYVNYHGGIRVLGELASARIATPIKITADQFKANDDLNPLVRSWNNPMPWPGGTWRLSHIVDYALTASYAMLRYAADNRQEWVKNAYRVALNAVSDKDDKPTFLIPPKQHDPYAVYELLSLLQKGLVEVYRAKYDFVADGTLYPKGTFVIPAAQPYSSYVRTLLEERDYPTRKEDGQQVPIHPYDVTTHNLPLLFGVKIITIKSDINTDLSLVRSIEPPKGKLSGKNKQNGYLLDFRSNQAVKALQKLYDQSSELYWLRDSVATSKKKLPPGTIWIKSKDEPFIKSIVKEFSVDVYRAGKIESTQAYQLSKPRVGLYQSYDAPIDEGWTRYVLEQYNIAYSTLHNDDIKTGDLADLYDVIILPHQSVDKIVNGVKDSLPPQYCGGIEEVGVDQLKRFVEKGGTLITLNAACGLPLTYFWLGVKDVTKDLSEQEYNVPGSLLKIIVDTSNPIGYGLPREVAGFNYKSPAFELAEGQPVATYPGQNLLLNGWITGEKYISLKAAIAELELGRGSVILIGLRPQFRAQARGTFKFLFNAIIKGAAKPVNLPE